jgi:threonine dehydrogenase-like Zn-dependent dehydrogenase
MDGKPVIGEQIAVFGQGVVGLLTTGLLARFPLTNLVAVDFLDLRRAKAAEFGAKYVLDPGEPTFPDEICAILGRGEQAGADLAYELSGNPAALDQALDAIGFGGRIVIGSWYGAKRADIDLGGRFHRNRIRILSSQVSTIGPEFTGLWTKTRRLSLARKMLIRLSPESLITHRFDVTDADDAYALTAERPESVIQVIITYED